MADKPVPYFGSYEVSAVDLYAREMKAIDERLKKQVTDQLFGIDRAEKPLQGAVVRDHLRVNRIVMRDDDATDLYCETAYECGKAHLVKLRGETLAACGLEIGPRRERRRASDLADQCGALTTENTQLLAENARLRRRVEDLERKSKVRR